MSIRWWPCTKPCGLHRRHGSHRGGRPLCSTITWWRHHRRLRSRVADEAVAAEFAVGIPNFTGGRPRSSRGLIDSDWPRLDLLLDGLSFEFGCGSAAPGLYGSIVVGLKRIRRPQVPSLSDAGENVAYHVSGCGGGIGQEVLVLEKVLDVELHVDHLAAAEREPFSQHHIRDNRAAAEDDGVVVG